MANLNENNVMIREVYRHNLEAEIKLIRQVVQQYKYVAMDTEFPGVVYPPKQRFNSTGEDVYKCLRLNVNSLKLLQIGFTFSNEGGELPRCGTERYCVWQFNFCDFNPYEDQFVQASYDLLKNSGMKFEDNMTRGVRIVEFAELLMSSGVVLDDEITWLTFHGSSDFGYLLKALTGSPLPETREKFLLYAKIFFPKVYDIKHLALLPFHKLHGGLNRIAESLGVHRIGTGHQAGSDSLLTSCLFFKLREKYFQKGIPTAAQNNFPDLMFGGYY